MNESTDARRRISFQGDWGAYSHLACREAAPDYDPLPRETFEASFAACSDGEAVRAMIPIENSVAGRVADIHHLLPGSDLFLIGEHFQRVHHQLLAIEAASIETVKEVHSHIHALSQCRKLIRELGIKPEIHADTAGACRMVAERNDPSIAAIGSSLAAETHRLKILRDGVQDHDNNITRFLIMARERIVPHPKDGPVMTSLIFDVASVPAALYKALGGFATNGINITKLESYMLEGSFEQAQFYADIEGHPDNPAVKRALEELAFFSKSLRVLGTYPRNPFRG